MRKRIEELAEGRVECDRPVIDFSVDRVELEVLEGKMVTGEFVIASKNQVPIRGVVYSSNPRMVCLTSGFKGEEIHISYEFHSEGLVEGDIQKGEFCIVCNQAEYNLSFVVVISKSYAESEIGTIRDLKEFARLSQSNWQEAVKIFYSPCFTNILKRQELTERLLYNGIAKGMPTERNLEEFLLACKCKEQIEVSAEQTKQMFYHITERCRQQVTLTKNTWGYVEFAVTSDASFLLPEKEKITSLEFIGSKAELGFYLCPEKMHAGKNYASLLLRNMHQEIVISVCATFNEEGTLRDKANSEIRKLHTDLLKVYVEYRLKRIVTGKWALKSCRILDDLMARDSQNVWYRLLKAQILFINGQRQESEWLLDEFKRKWKDKKSPQWAYYMYICTLMEHEELYIDRMTEEIERIYLENKENTILFWCLLFMKEEYAQNRYQKLKALEERIMSKTESPLLYVEVYCLYCQEPYLMNHLGEFEWKILNWTRKQKMLTRPLAEQVISVFPERLEYQRLILLVLEACYEQVADERMLRVICAYLIRNQKYGRRFFRWYAKGIEEKIKITGLYEAYLLSMDNRTVEEVPKIIQMYFKYNNQLGYQQKAVLYVNLIAAKEKQPDVYEQYYPALERFAYEQMELKRMDDNLAVIYEDILSRGIYSPHLSEVLADVLFVHKLTCFVTDAARVIVIQEQLECPIEVPLVSGVAYFPLYSNDYGIFIEDCYGNRYSGSVSYQLEKLMHPGRYLRICMQNAPEKLPYLFYYFSNHKAQEVFEEKDLIYFQTIMKSDQVSRKYQAWLFPKMFVLLSRLEQTEDMKKQLQGIDLSEMDAKDRGRVLTICVEHQLFEEAYAIAEEYGFEQIPVSARVRLISYQIHKLDFAKDDNVLSVCAETFAFGKYNDAMLEYLCRYYQGSTKFMAGIYKAAKAFEIDTDMIEERILVQLLYSEEFLDSADEIYDSYKKHGNKKLKQAYFTYFSHCSFLKEMVLSKAFFEALREWMTEEKEQNAICELAMLKYYSVNPSLLETDKEKVETILKKYLFQGISFALYKQLSLDLIIKYQLYDKYFIEYHGKRHNKVLLHYKMRDADGDYTVEEMTEVYDGIFVKEMTLFIGDVVQYYISEEQNGEMVATESNLLVCSDIYDEIQNSRYERLNEMIFCYATEEISEFAERMAEYEQLDSLVEDGFTVIK